MKKIVSLIIISISIFSMGNTAFAEEGYIEQLLDLNVGIEHYDLELANLDYIYLRDNQTRSMYNNFNETNAILKNEIIRKYRVGEFSYYQTKGIISNHKKFVYYTNELFYYVSLKEQNRNYKELDDAILKSYTKVRSYYRNVKNLVNQR